MCGCSGSCTGSCVIDLTGIGQVGDTGPQGGYGGWSSLWDFSTTTTTGTTAGQLRFNNATYASVTAIYVNTTNADNTNVSNFLATFSNGNYFGKLRIFKKSDSTKFWEGTITNVSVLGSEYTLTVTYVLANSTFANTDEVVMSFTPNGIGAKPLIFAAPNPPGTTTSLTTGSWVTLNSLSYTIPAGTLATDGDYIEVIYSGEIGQVASITEANGIRAILNGSDAITGLVGYDITGGGEIFHHVDTTIKSEYELKIKVVRATATDIVCFINCQGTLKLPIICMSNGGASITVNNLTTNTNTIAPQIYHDTGNNVSVIDVKIIKYLQ